MSVEIFEQTMPSAKHWRINHKTGTDAMNENLQWVVSAYRLLNLPKYVSNAVPYFQSCPTVLVIMQPLRLRV